ncbi:MAG: 4Fe-4S binding protein [Lachnospiraceae bacterium]
MLEINSFLLVLIGLAAFTILFGRYFCGYVCAFGTLGDFVYWISGMIQKKLFRKKKQFSLSVSLPESCFSALQKVKYLILAAIVVFSTLGIYEKLTGISPWDVFSMLTAGRFYLKGYAAGTVILLLIVVGMALQERFFCQFLCPMGAVFALLPIIPPAVLKRNEEKCRKGCSLCRKKCPVQLKLEADSLLSGECIRCGRCASACPGENIHSLEGRLTGSEIWLVIGKAVLFFFMGTVLGLCRFL